MALDIRKEAPDVSIERRVESESNILHPRHGMKLVFYLLVESLQLTWLIAGLERIQIDDDAVVGF